jgi:uncharacterized protein (TIGR03083 family)
VDWIEIIEREGDALAKAARQDMRAAIPSCPGWDMGELVRHCSTAHRWATNGLRATTTERPGFDEIPADAGVEWFEEGLAALLAALRDADPSEPAWTFDPNNRTKSFWFRRQSHETAVHRVDAEQAVGIDATVDAELAADGIDELLTAYVPRIVKHAGIEPGGTVHVHTTDVEGEWLLEFGEDGPKVERSHAKGDAAVRGAAAHIYLWLWGRAPMDGLEVFGDPALAAKLRRATTA